jgi:hypothetical protein
VYQLLFGQQFNAHDAEADIQALKRIVFDSNLKLSVQQVVDNASIFTANDMFEKVRLTDERCIAKAALQRAGMAKTMSGQLLNEWLDAESHTIILSRYVLPAAREGYGNCCSMFPVDTQSHWLPPTKQFFRKWLPNYVRGNKHEYPSMHVVFSTCILYNIRIDTKYANYI